MRLTVKTKTKEDYIYLPATEKELQKICDKFDIPNNMSASVTIKTDYDDNRLAKILAYKEVNLNELNFLLRKLVDFDTDYDLETFYAVASAEKFDNLKDLINLSYNTHCYHLVTDFKDLNALGRTLYLNEHGSASKEFLDRLEGDKFIDDIMKNRKILSASTNGLIYTNKNNPIEHYNGQVFPLHFHTSPLITVELSGMNYREYLFLPCEETELTKALERLKAPNLDVLKLSIYEYNIPEKIMAIGESTDFYELNNFANILEKVGNSELEHLSKLVEFTNVDNVADLETLTKSMFEIEIHPNIRSHNILGYEEIAQSGRFEFDENLEDYIDFERYGKVKMEQEKGIFTDKGYISYQGYNEDMIEILNKNLKMGLCYEKYSETLKLYMPLKVESFYEEDDYGQFHPCNYAEEIDSSELCGLEDELSEFIENYQDHYETERKLMEYYR